MAYYTVCREATSLAEIEEMEGNLFLPAFRRLQFADANKPLIKKLLYKAFQNAKKQCDKWGDFRMNIAPYAAGQTATSAASLEELESMSKEELIRELIKARINEARLKKGYEVKGDGTVILYGKENTK